MFVFTCWFVVYPCIVLFFTSRFLSLFPFSISPLHFSFLHFGSLIVRPTCPRFRCCVAFVVSFVHVILPFFRAFGFPCLQSIFERVHSIVPRLHLSIPFIQSQFSICPFRFMILCCFFNFGLLTKQIQTTEQRQQYMKTSSIKVLQVTKWNRFDLITAGCRHCSNWLIWSQMQGAEATAWVMSLWVWTCNM